MLLLMYCIRRHIPDDREVYPNPSDSDSLLFPCCFDGIVAFFSTPLVPFFFSGVCDIDPARYQVAGT
jgi:hypothetical protein